MNWFRQTLFHFPLAMTHGNFPQPAAHYLITFLITVHEKIAVDQIVGGIFESPLGTKILLYKDHLYHEATTLTCKKNEDVTVWRCSKRKTPKVLCKAFVRLMKYSHIIDMMPHHNHEPVDDQLKNSLLPKMF